MPEQGCSILFKLTENDADNKAFKAELIITNNTAKEIKNWKLCFDFFRPSETHCVKISDCCQKKAKLAWNLAEYTELQGLVNIPSQGNLTVKVSGDWIIRKYSDTPSCYFLVIGEKKIIPLSATSDFSLVKMPTLEFPKIEMPPSFASKIKEQIRLIPVPTEAKIKSGTFDFNRVNTISDLENSDHSKGAVQSFLKNFKSMIKFKSDAGEKCTASISIKRNQDLKIDDYILDISKDSIVLEANSRGGYLYGLISIFRLALAYENKIPCMEISDSPRFEYRGILLDVARNFRTVKEVKKHLKMMALYKLNIFHCRLTDDEGWRVEVKKYPNITDIGAFRGYGEIIPPLHGSGAKKIGGYYTHEELREIIDYANSLNITFIPEMVVPSHARALIASFTSYKGKDNPLVEKADKSKYATPQGFSDNVLSPAIDFTYELLEDIYREIIEIFSVQKGKMAFGEFIHIGGDEVPHGAWIQSPICKKLMADKGLKSAEELQHYFMRKMQDIVEKYGCRTAGWEEVIKGGEFPSKELLVYSWLGQKAGFEASEKGFPVVMVPAQYVYFDLAYNESPGEPGLYWGGYSNPRIIYSYEPIPENARAESVKNIKGIQACLWSELLGKPKLANADKYHENYVANPLEYMAFPKMTAFSEAAWSSSENRNWKSFVKRYEDEKNIFELFDIKYCTNKID